MLKHRLIFGTLMTVFFTAVVVLDGWLDGSLTALAPNKPIQGTGLCLLIAVLAILAQLEFSKLASVKNIKAFHAITIPASILLATSWYWPQFYSADQTQFHLLYIIFVTAFSLLAMFIYQANKFTTENVIINCGANFFSVFYLGFLSSFVLAIRIQFGLWELLMFVFVIKSCDIGAYTFGTLFGRHKFSPKISPKKTWEGMAGAVAVAIIVAVSFAASSDIITLWHAVIFGVCFAFIGQLGDLAESMIKRDAEQKDSANNVPGFGGVLDIIDSPLAAACFAYLFFMYCSK